MKCVACGRPLCTPAISVPSREGVWNFGPVCARKRGLVKPREKQRARIFDRHVPVPVDPRQLKLELHA